MEPLAHEVWFTQKLDIWFEDSTARKLIESSEFKHDLVYEDSQHIKVTKKLLGCGGDFNEKNSEG